MKTRLSTKVQYNAGRDLKSSKNARARSQTKKLKKRSYKRKSKARPRKIGKQSYKEAHEVGRRRSSQFVTYSQDTRLFYDLYAKNEPYTSDFVSVGDKNTLYHASNDPVNVIRATPKRRLKTNANPTSSIPPKVSRKVMRKSSRREASLNATIKMDISRRTFSPTKQRRGTTPKKPKASKKKSPVNLKRASTDKRSMLERKLKRELGVESIPPMESPGRRLASLNAVAIINAVTANNRVRHSEKYHEAPRKRQLSVETIPCLDTVSSDSHECLSDKSEDATTEPMCASPERKSPIKRTPSTVQTVPVTKKRQRSRRPDRGLSSLKTPVTNSSNSTVASYHSERIIPLGENEFGIQQITQKVIRVTPPEKPTFDKNSNYAAPSHPSTMPSSTISVSQNITDTQAICLSLPPVTSNQCNSTGALSLPVTLSMPSYGYFQSLPPSLFAIPQMPPTFPYQSPSICYPTTLPFPHQLPSFYPTTFSTNLRQPPQVVCLPPILGAPFTGFSPVQPFNVIQPPTINESIYPIHPAYYPVCPPQDPRGLAHVYMSAGPNQVDSSVSTPQISFPPVFHAPLSALSGASQLTIPTTTSLSTNSNVHSLTPPPPSELLHHMPPERALSNSVSEDSTTEKAATIVDTDTQASATQTLESLHSNPDLPPSLNDEAVYSVDLPKRTPTPIVKESSSLTKPEMSPINSENVEGAWQWEGEVYAKPVFFKSECSPVSRQCYRAIRHCRDGILIRERDVVLLCSGPDRCNPPHVAKVTALFADPKTGIKMMALLWYYRSEHIGSSTTTPILNELYASRHCDVNPVDCIEDRAYVLTANAFARFMARLKHSQSARARPPLSCVVPPASIPDNDFPPERDQLTLAADNEPPDTATLSNVFVCHGVYDYRLKRVCRNVNFHTFSLYTHFLASTSHRSKQIDQDAPNTSRPSAQDSRSPSPPVLISACEETERHSPDRSSPNSPALCICLPDSPENTAIVTQTSQMESPSPQNGKDTTTMESIGSNTSPEGSTNVPPKDISCITSPSFITTLPGTNGHQSTPVKSTSTNSSNIRCSPSIITTGSIPSTPHFSGTSIAQPSLPISIPKQPVRIIPPNHQPNLSLGSLNWPSTPGFSNVDSSVLENSADLSVNWAEHGEQIALSLDCGNKEAVLSMHNPTTSTVVATPLTVGAQPIANHILLPGQFSQPPVPTIPVQYAVVTNTPNHIEPDSPHLVIL